MKKTFLLILLFILLSGCSEIRYAKADKIRAETRRANERHAKSLAEAQATADTRIATKQMTLWSFAVAGAIVLISGSVAIGYSLIGFSLAKVRQASFMLVPLDPQTRQYPMIIYRYRGNRAFLPNCAQRVLLDEDAPPHPQLTTIAGQVQLAGVNNQKLIEVRNVQ